MWGSLWLGRKREVVLERRGVVSDNGEQPSVLSDKCTIRKLLFDPRSLIEPSADVALRALRRAPGPRSRRGD